MKVYYRIDGTDNLDTTSMGAIPGQTLLVTSYVKRICTLGFDRFFYRGGTTHSITGIDTGLLASEAVTWIKNHVETNGSGVNTKVYLGGFSRGGASVTLAAHDLEREGIDVEAMFLFDSVDRTLAARNSKTRRIPGNVKKAFHAIRRGDTDSRTNFGNCGLIGTNGNLVGIEFYTSHGGMGGWRLDSSRLTDRGVYHERGATKTSNVTPLQQLSGSLAVWNWMNDKILNSLLLSGSENTIIDKETI